MTTLITGATRGIGRGLYDAARAAGESVIGTYRDQRPDDDGDWLALDLNKPHAATELAEAFGQRALSLLVCNAGIYADKGHDLETGYAPELWAETFAVNVTGVFLTIRALLPALRRARGARIAILSSVMASTARAPGGAYIYRASKAAVLNLGRNLATDLKPEGISIGIYHPGWVRTDMGGATADIGLDEAIIGLRRRFEKLGPASTGCFEAWDGAPIPY